MDSTIFDLHQDELEQHIFRCIQEEGFTDVEISRFKLVNRFKQSRNPLVIFMCGLPSDTKTLIAQELSHTMHVPNVLRTDDIEEILRQHPSVCMDTHRSILDTSLDGTSSMIEEYKKECQIIHKAMQHDVLKAFKDGKSIIIEGFHLDPEYIVQQYVVEQRYDVTLFRGGVDDTSTRHSALVIPILIHMDQDQYVVDAQSWIGTSTGSTVDSQCLVERVHSTIGEYLQHTCRSHAIPAIQVDMVDWNKALEDIHEYILQGIEMMMTDRYIDTINTSM